MGFLYFGENNLKLVKYAKWTKIYLEYVGLEKVLRQVAQKVPKSAKSCKMSRKVRNEQKLAKSAKMSKKC